MQEKKFERNVADQMEFKSIDENIRDRTFLRFQDQKVTFKQFYDTSLAYSHLFMSLKNDAGAADGPVKAAVFMDNHPAFMYTYGGTALSGGTLFGVNTGLRGQVLAELLNKAGCQFIVTDDRHYDRIHDVRDKLENITSDRILVVDTVMEDFTKPDDVRWVDETASNLKKEMGDNGLKRPDVEINESDNLMVIYTSGTTGLPKGIKNSHKKLLTLGTVTGGVLRTKPHDIGYVCMPLFHSNAMFLAVMGSFVYNASIVIRDKFSASGFAPDILKYGVTFWNYVGQPVHYVILALEAKYGSEDAIVEAIAKNPDNKLRFAYGNGASQVDQDKFIKYFDLEHMFEAYGSTEMAIAVVRVKGDPPGCVGNVFDPNVKIYNDNCEECPPAEYDERGKFINYQEAVGEIVRETGALSNFEGYHDNPEADANKTRNGVYHSGDLGHIRLTADKRYLYFDGRTDDWIRKDGENFSAENVAQVVCGFDPIEHACAYGVPCPVSDEWVMVALRLHDGRKFDLDEFYKYCDDQCNSGDMDRKWMPDFVRVIEEFEHTRTQKILVRPLKHEFYNLEWVPADTIYFTTRGLDTYKPFTVADMEALREKFKQSGRERFLETWR